MNKEIVFLSVSGPDQPGITSRLTKVLASFGGEVLDIDQAVIHETLAWGMMVQLPTGNTEKVLKELLFVTHDMGLELRQKTVSDSAYQQWVGNQASGRSIVTLLGRQLEARQLAAVTELIREHRHNISSIKRISSRTPKTEHNQHIAAVEIQINGEADRLSELRSNCLALSSDIDLDIAIQQNSVWRRNRRLVCFDMDSTLIEDEVIDLLADAAGVRNQVAEITERAMNGEIDFEQSFRQRLSSLAGLDASIFDTISDKINVTEGAERLIRNLQRLGLKTAIISGGFSFFANRLATQLGIDFVHANELEIANGQLTGRHVGSIIDADRKVAIMREIAQQQGINEQQVIAVGDGANDVPMLSAAGLGIAFRAKQVVRRQADYAVGSVGLDAILYLIGMREEEIVDR